MLTITPLPAHHLTPQDYPLADSNRFECRTCPYQMVLDRRYFERRDFDLRAAVEGGGGEVLGGQESWRNVDRTEGISTLILGIRAFLRADAFGFSEM